mgnify:CR=1 FL=1|tara:strand:- start:4730 stop:5041 length:312 start_codon:yes stop_codon:yes gene_type:complete
MYTEDDPFFYDKVFDEIVSEIENLPDAELLEELQGRDKFTFVVQEQEGYSDVKEAIEEALLNLGLSVIYNFNYLNEKEIGRNTITNQWEESFEVIEVEYTLGL